MSISGCIIAKNEEKDIEKCIKSLKKVCDEIILIDTGSIDNTVKIAKKNGAKVYFFQWIDDFAAAKNYAIDKANGEWILFLDADEYLWEERKEVYIQLINNAKYFDSILCEILNIDDDGSVAQIHIGNRLFRNNKNIMFKGKIHEDLQKDGKNLYSINGGEYIKIIHTGYTKEKVYSKGKFQRNLSILLKELEISPNDPKIYYYIADTYGLEHNLQKQKEFSKKSILNGKIDMIGFDELPYILLIQSMFGLSENIEVIKNEINNAIKEFPKSPVFRYFLASALLKEGKYSLCFKNMLRSLEMRSEYEYYSVDYMQQYSNDIYKICGYIYKLKKDNNLALEYYIKSIKVKPLQKDVLIYLYNLLRNENPTEIILFLNKLYDITNKKHIEFLIETFTALNNAILLAYYEKKLYDITGCGNNAVIMSLLRNKNYISAFKKSFELYKDSYRYDLSIVMIISAIFSKDNNYIENIKKIVKPSFMRIINSVENKNISLYNEDKDDYIKILTEVIRIYDLENIDTILIMAEKFENPIWLEIGDIFNIYNNYEYAMIYYEKALETNTDDKWFIYKKIAIIYYNIGNYEDSFEIFIKALNVYNYDNEIFEYLYFMYEICDNELIKNKIRELSTQYTQVDYLLHYKEEGDLNE